jgi:hypothetical protein
MLRPAGPSILFPDLELDTAEAVIESPPEWGPPGEGNPNQPRRPPEYQPPQDPVPGRGPGRYPEFDPPQRTPTSPPVPTDPPMRPLRPDEQPEIPPGDRNPLRKAPDQMPGSPAPRRGDEETQPQPGEARLGGGAEASASGADEEDDGPLEP